MSAVAAQAEEDSGLLELSVVVLLRRLASTNSAASLRKRLSVGPRASEKIILGDADYMLPQ